MAGKNKNAANNQRFMLILIMSSSVFNSLLDCRLLEATNQVPCFGQFICVANFQLQAIDNLTLFSLLLDVSTSGIRLSANKTSPVRM